jgi:hypothetical protein
MTACLASRRTKVKLAPTVRPDDLRQRAATWAQQERWLRGGPWATHFSSIARGGRRASQGNAAETAQNIMAHERLFRLGIASYLLGQMSDVALITALYVILKMSFSSE